MINKILKDPVVGMTILTLIMIAFHVVYQPNSLSRIETEKVHKFEVDIFFEPGNDGVTVRTFLPQDNNRQEIIQESINSGNLTTSTLETDLNRQVVWTGTGTKHINYNALLSIAAVEYKIDNNLVIEENYPEEIMEFLTSTDAMPINHPEIEALWQSIRPSDSNFVMPVLRSIYDYTYNEIEGAPFKGFTDALTALRLKQASCNGKGRLFVALARHVGIPARLVGGVILNGERKKTSHQWVEVYIQNHWVPFDPTNGYFANIPDYYVQLYLKDKVLFSHTSDINFDYYFSSHSERLPSLLIQHGEEDQQSTSNMNIVKALTLSGMTENTARIFLLFPLCTLIVVFIRNIVGFRTLGVFVPMLIASACVYTGLFMGIAMFIGVLFFAFLSHLYLEKLKLLKVPRLAAIITVLTMVIIGFIIVSDVRNPLQLGMLSLFPMVIISFLAERIHDMAVENDWMEMLISTSGSLGSIILCYLSLTSLYLQSVFAILPELLFIVLALIIFIGRWPGIRVVEYFRFRKIVGQGETLGINQRNINFVNLKNSKKLLELAIDKMRTKEALSVLRIPVTETVIKCEDQSKIEDFMQALKRMETCVIKPNRGSRGKGIIVLTGRDGNDFITAGGKRKTLDDLRLHTIEILTGAYSQSGNIDQAYIEPLVIQYDSINELANLGLADIRIIIHEGKLVSSMLRLPTTKSDGKANLHQGAIGLNIDMDSGKVTSARLKGKSITTHPDTGAELIDFQVPYWQEIKEISSRCFDAMPLGYLGVDICIDHVRGPLVLEVNGRPGLEIQNVREKGLINDLA